MRESYDRLQFGQVDVDGPAVFGVFVCCDDVVFVGDAAFFVGYRLFVDGENPVLRTGFNSHVGNGQAVGHGEGRHAFAGEFQRFVQRAVDADHADEGQHDVLARNVVRLLPRQVDVDGFGHLEPRFARGHGHAQIGRADAGGKAA